MRLLPLFASVAFLLFGASFSKAQLEDELIVQVPSANEKNLDLIRQDLLAINGVSYFGYCETEKCFFLHVDRKINEDNTPVETVLKNLGLEFYFKTSVTIEKARDNCGSFRGVIPFDPHMVPKN